jgi:hypothetical protein
VERIPVDRYAFYYSLIDNFSLRDFVEELSDGGLHTNLTKHYQNLANKLGPRDYIMAVIDIYKAEFNRRGKRYKVADAEIGA